MNCNAYKPALVLLGLIVAPGLGATTFTLTNSTPIVINDSWNPPTPANPYPTEVVVAGTDGTLIKKLTVTFHGFSHEFPSDVHVLLVGPQGQMSILMSKAGGSHRYSVTNLVLVLDDDASMPLPLNAPLTSGVFRPTNGYELMGHPSLPFTFPPPAPPGNSVAPTGFSIFKDTDPTGVWKLFVVDNASGDLGEIAGGWTLSITLSARLEISQIGTDVVIWWPSALISCHLQALQDHGSDWTDVPADPVEISGRAYVTNPITGEHQLFRLIGY
jgi:subtilisin-like proprotein convertase family protein